MRPALANTNYYRVSNSRVHARLQLSYFFSFLWFLASTSQTYFSTGICFPPSQSFSLFLPPPLSLTRTLNGCIQLKLHRDTALLGYLPLSLQRQPAYYVHAREKEREPAIPVPEHIPNGKRGGQFNEFTANQGDHRNQIKNTLNRVFALSLSLSLSISTHQVGSRLTQEFYYTRLICQDLR